MSIEEQISAGIMSAMKSKDKVSLETLRNVKKYIIEARSAGKDVEFTDSDCLKIIQKLSKQGIDSANIYKEQNRDDLYQYEMAQVEVLKSFLPQQLSDAELTQAISDIIASLGASGMKDMGKVMGVASKQLSGKAEGKDISTKVKELLA